MQFIQKDLIKLWFLKYLVKVNLNSTLVINVPVFQISKVLLKYGNQIINFNNNKIYLTQLVLLWLIIDNKIIFLVQLTIKIISNNNKSNLETYSILLQLITTLLIQSIYFKILGRINNNQIYSTKIFLLITNLNLNRIE